MIRIRGRAGTAPPSPAPLLAGTVVAGHPERGEPARSIASGRPRRRWWRSFGGEVWRWFVVVLLFGLLAPLAAGLVLLGAIYRQARTDQTRAVDAIVVLGTAQYNGRPGAVFQARLDRAYDIFAAGYAPVIIVAGGRQPGDQFTEAEAGRDYLVELGVPAAAIWLENDAPDSWQSMLGAARLLSDPAHRRVLLVSDGFHLFRVKLMARDVGLIPFAAPAVASPIRPGGPGEFSYALREMAAIVVHLGRTR